MQKSSNTVALVESFLGEFKPDDESTPESVTPDKTIIKVTVENKEELLDNLQPLKETLINDSRICLKLENVVSKEINISKSDITDVCEPENKSDNDVKETVEEYVTPVLEQLPPSPPSPPPPQQLLPPPPPPPPPQQQLQQQQPPPPPPPAKRKVCFIQLFTNSKL